jgi:tripartite-type tricarboxylate transporter receptor subunit TctC
VSKIHSDAVAALEHASVKQRYEAIGAPVTTSTPAELAARLVAEAEKWGPVIKDAGIKPE